MFRQKTIILVSMIILIVISGYIIYYLKYQFPQKIVIKQEKEEVFRNVCLSDNEVAEYSIYPSKRKYIKDPLFISVKDRNTDQEKYNFQIENVSLSYHALEIHKCGVFVIRVFNFDDEKGIPLPDYRTELWQYQYDGSGRKIIDLFKKEEAPDNYGQDFRIDFSETYIALERSYLSNPNYALVIKDLKTKDDVYVLSLNEIVKKYPEIEGSIGFNEWNKNGRYFWFNIFSGANILAFFRLERDAWQVNIFPAPKDVLGGDALNLENGYITVHPGNIWFGIAEIYEQEKEKRRQQGIGTQLYIHNLFTGDRKFVASTTEPLHYFKPKWLSDTELEYELPTGEKKIYKIEE